MNKHIKALFLLLTAVTSSRLCRQKAVHYGSASFVDTLICPSVVFRNMLFDKVCPNGNCPPCSSKYISIHGGTASLNKCVKNVQRTRRTSQHRYLCGAFIADTCQSAESMARNTCAMVPSSMTPATGRLLAYECCQQKLESKKSEFVCRGEIDDDHAKSIKMNVRLPNGHHVEASIEISAERNCCASMTNV